MTLSDIILMGWSLRQETRRAEIGGGGRTHIHACLSPPPAPIATYTIEIEVLNSLSFEGHGVSLTAQLIGGSRKATVGDWKINPDCSGTG